MRALYFSRDSVDRRLAYYRLWFPPVRLAFARSFSLFSPSISETTCGLRIYSEPPLQARRSGCLPTPPAGPRRRRSVPRLVRRARPLAGETATPAVRSGSPGWRRGGPAGGGPRLFPSPTDRLPTPAPSAPAPARISVPRLPRPAGRGERKRKDLGAEDRAGWRPGVCRTRARGFPCSGGRGAPL